MASLQTFSTLTSSKSYSNGRSVAMRHIPRPNGRTRLSLQKLLTKNMEQLNSTTNPTDNVFMKTIPKTTTARDADSMAKLYAIAEAVADRAHMHAAVEEQRNNWNNLLVNSINAITLTAATMAGLSAFATNGSMLAFQVSSALLYSAATGLLLLVNKIQPSQLAEEQRNAARLFNQLYGQIQTIMALHSPTPLDVKDAMAQVLALDKAYPLPLLPGMLEKFPEKVEPTVWWPRPQKNQQSFGGSTEKNGWNEELEEEMKGILSVLKRKDSAEFVRLSKLVLKINRILATIGPMLTGVAAIGATLVGSSGVGSWAVVVAVAGGALASVVNTLEHGGQVGMVFEMYRNCAGFFRLLEETIESNLNETDLDRRENGEILELKMALQLGRSLSELRVLASSENDAITSEFASKLF